MSERIFENLSLSDDNEKSSTVLNPINEIRAYQINDSTDQLKEMLSARIDRAEKRFQDRQIAVESTINKAVENFERAQIEAKDNIGKIANQIVEQRGLVYAGFIFLLIMVAAMLNDVFFQRIESNRRLGDQVVELRQQLELTKPSEFMEKDGIVDKNSINIYIVDSNNGSSSIKSEMQGRISEIVKLFQTRQ